MFSKKKSELFLNFFDEFGPFLTRFDKKKTLECTKIQSKTAKILIFEEKKF
jgi:hypothetical protein